MKKNINLFLESTFFKVFTIFYIVFISIIIIFSVDIFSPYHSFNNISDSMAPTINQGSITIVKEFPAYDVGDIISYYDNTNGYYEIITHRIRAVGGNVYTTKGDANEVYDRFLVKPRLVIGKVILVIPTLGYIITFTKSSLGTALCIILPAALIVLAEMLKIGIYLKKEDYN